MPTRRLVKAFVEVDGKPVEEFGEEQDADDGNVVSCFIASEAGKVSAQAFSYFTRSHI